MVDRRAILGRSRAELVMSRVGRGVGVLCLFILLPLLPLLLALALGGKLAQLLKRPAAGDEGPGRTGAGGT